ncbi:MAG: hypothetical protein AAF682_26570 [Planctomycetota bacterium]
MSTTANPLIEQLLGATAQNAALTYKNTTSLTLELYRTDDSGGTTTQVATLEPGASEVFFTYTDSTWEARDSYSGYALTTTKAPAGAKTVTVSSKGLTSPESSKRTPLNDLTFENPLPISISIARVDSAGQSVAGPTLAPGESATVQSAADDVWIIKQSGKTGELALFITGDDATQTCQVMIPSFGGAAATYVEFLNQTTLTLDLKGLDSTGSEVTFDVLAPGDFRHQGTFVGRELRLVDQVSGKQVAGATAAPDGTFLSVDGRRMFASASQTGVQLTLQNNAPFEIEAYSVDTTGRETLEATLKSGSATILGTFSLCPWRLRRQMGGAEVALYITGTASAQTLKCSPVSATGGDASTTTFVNGTMLWLNALKVDSQGVETQVGTVAPSASLTLDTTSGEVYLLRDAESGFVVDLVTAWGRPQTSTVDDSSLLPNKDEAAVSIAFQNSLDVDVDLYLMGEGDAEDFIATVASGESTTQAGHAASPWILREHVTQTAVGNYIPTDAAAQSTTIHLKSSPGTAETDLTFENRGTRTVDVYWLDEDGKEQLFKRLEQRQAFRAKTCVSHFWLVRDTDSGRPVKLARGQEDGQLALLTGNELRTIAGEPVDPIVGTASGMVLSGGTPKSGWAYEFENKCPYSIELYLVNEDGDEELKDTLVQYQFHKQTSGTSEEVWRARQVDSGVEVATFITQTSQNIVTIEDGTVTQPPVFNIAVPVFDSHGHAGGVLSNGNGLCRVGKFPGIPSTKFAPMTPGFLATITAPVLTEVSSADNLREYLADAPLLSPDAAIGYSKTCVGLVQGSRYAEWNPTQATPKISKDSVALTDAFPGLPFAQVDSAVHLKKDQVAFFLGASYATYDTSSRKVVAQGDVSDGFKGVNYDRIDAAARIGDVIVFYSGDSFLRFDYDEKKKLSEDKISSLPSDSTDLLPAPILMTGDVAIYAETDYNGTAWIVSGDQPSFSELTSGTGSLRVGPGTVATAFSTTNYGGKNQVFYLNRADLSVEDVTVQTIASVRTRPTVSAADQSITATAKLTEDHYKGSDGNMATKNVYCTVLSLPGDVKQVEIGATQQATIEIKGKSKTVDAVSTWTVSPNMANQLVIQIDAAELGTPALQIHTNTMPEGEMLYVFPDADVCDRLAGLEQNAIYDNRVALGVDSDATQDDCLGVEEALRDLGRSVRVEGGPTGTRVLDASNAKYDAWALNFKNVGSAESVFQPMSATDVVDAFKSATWVDDDVTQSLSLGLGGGIAAPVQQSDVYGVCVTTVADVTEDVGEATVDFAEGDFEAGVQELEKAGQTILQVGIMVADEVYTFVVDTVEKLIATVELIVEKIGMAIEDFIEFIKDLFAWGDVLDTQSYLMDCVNASVDSLIAGLDTLRSAVASGIEHARDSLDKDIDRLQSMLGGDAPAKPSDDDDGMERVHWLSDKMSSTGDTSSAGDSLPQDAINNAFSQIQGLVEKDFGDGGTVVSAVENVQFYLQEAADDVKSGDLDGAAKCVAAALLEVVQTMADLALDLIEGMVDLFFGVFEALLGAVKEAMNAELDIPVLSDVYEFITDGQKLSMLSLVALLAAIPTTVVWKVSHSGAPFAGMSVPQGTPSSSETFAITYACTHAVAAFWALLANASTLSGQETETTTDVALDMGSFGLGCILQISGNPIGYFHSDDGVGLFSEAAAEVALAKDWDTDPSVRPKVAAGLVWWYQWLTTSVPICFSLAGIMPGAQLVGSEMDKLGRLVELGLGLVHTGLFVFLSVEEWENAGLEDLDAGLRLGGYLMDVVPELTQVMFLGDEEAKAFAYLCDPMGHAGESIFIVLRITRSDF